MKSAFFESLSAWLGTSLVAVSALILSVLPFPANAQDSVRDQGGISTPLLSRCAGKFGAQLRAGDKPSRC
jgi:hypothetical protein